MLQMFRQAGDGDEDLYDYGSKFSKQSKQVGIRGLFDNKGINYKLLVIIVRLG